jgi:cyclic beta-1,2-glucan synthetase
VAVKFLQNLGLLAAKPRGLWDDKNAIREDLFSVERLEFHARSLATAQPILKASAGEQGLSRRLRDNARVLLDAHKAIAEAAAAGGGITPAAVWLLDNYYLVERQIHDIQTDLPPGYYRQLPKLAAGPFLGYPRVLGLAWAFVAHIDSRFDPESLCRYVAAYQEVQALMIGELWALGTTLRIILIENLRRLAEAVVVSRVARQEADLLADRLLGLGGHKTMPTSDLFGYRDRTTLADAFAAQLVYRLRDQDPSVTPALTWLDERLARQQKTAESVVRDELQRQGAASITVQNIITSIRLISDVDWAELVERLGTVDRVLVAGCDFMAMDFATRNLYRSAVEALARGSSYSEIAVARQAVAAAEDTAAGDLDPTGERWRDPGYYLLGGGRAAFETELGFRPTWRSWPRRASRKFGIGVYAGAVIGVSAAILVLPLLALAFSGGPVGALTLCLIGLLGVVPAIDLAVALVNRLVIGGIGASLLPALALRDGIPAHLRTMVAVPMLLSSADAVAALIARLEVHYLASPGGELYFALLSDWIDADAESIEGDAALLRLAEEGIAQLNRRYSFATGSERFFLLHRRRVWNAGEGRWLGWERKRGKLHELNRLLRGAEDTTYLDCNRLSGLLPAGIRYVITLDADTRLPRDTVRRLIGKMAHPLNRPRFDPTSERIVEGYAVMQPRVTPSLPVGREGSLYQRAFSSMSGIDPYSAAVSDVYQDLFGEGSYAGKGIYEIDAFEAALSLRVPDSTLLSHDLFEGIFARAGLASDIEVVEEFPARYDVDAQRHHRWARGDWQLLPWIFGFAPTTGARLSSVGVPAIGRWKMFDNLRRSLSAPMAVLALFAGWMLPIHGALVWTVFVVATIVLPSLIPLATALLPARLGITPNSHFRALGNDLGSALTLSGLRLAVLADQAWRMTDAIARTLLRLFVTRRHLLEWVTAERQTVGGLSTVFGFYRSMAGAVAIGGAALIVAASSSYGAWPSMVPLGCLWVLSPAIAWFISGPPRLGGRHAPSVEDGEALRLIARRTWRYFEQFVTADDNMLPPDNFQETPFPVIAHRTSPTNIGLYLLSVATARDFGWIGSLEAVTRLEATFLTLGQLGRYRGHFYNWYDTQDLRPLDPCYISAVDSGNLAGHLIALANTCRDWIEHPSHPAPGLAGSADALALALKGVEALREPDHPQLLPLKTALQRLGAEMTEHFGGARARSEQLSRLARAAAALEPIVAELMSSVDGIGLDEVLAWIRATGASIRSQQDDLDELRQNPDALTSRLGAIEATARSMAMAMEFGFLFDPQRKLLSIGYLVSEGVLDSSCYDILASEARLASFVAIAKGDIPSRHWFRLGRAVTPVGHGAALISWSGSMFEYLMPSLVMRAPEGSLIEQTNRMVVQRQIEHAKALGVPWGISESAYNARDLELTYQYSNFGVPGLGLKRGLGANLVIAPYATALASMVDGPAAVRNFVTLTALGALGRYGFYEALDYTPSRVPEGAAFEIVRAFMAHHQGMTIVAIADTLLNGVMRTRFHAERIVEATELLLQERMPRDVMAARPFAAEAKSAVKILDTDPPGGRVVTTPHSANPTTHLLANGDYAVMLTAAGSGYSRWRDLAVTRWREDPTCDDWGAFIYLRDTESGTIWSAGFQPIGNDAENYAAIFREDRAEIARHDGALTTTLDVIVSPEDASEVRRVTITNSGNRARVIDVTSYAEIVLAPATADTAHPAFAKLFVATEFLDELGVILATRRRRSPDEPEIWAAHLAVVEGETVGPIQIETDRAQFLGRTGSARTAAAILEGRPLSNSVGSVLDPIFALRRRVVIPPRGTVRVAFWTMVASSRQGVVDLADTHRNATAFQRAGALAWTQAQVQLHHLRIDQTEANLFQQLAGYLLYASASFRPSEETIRRDNGSQSGLWPLGISGDLPILLLRVADIENVELVRQVLQAHEYWRMKQFAVDIVILNERASSYVQDLQITLEALVRSSQSRPQIRSEGPSGRVFVFRTDLIATETRALLIASARLVLVAQRGRLADQLGRALESRDALRVLRKPRAQSGRARAVPWVPEPEFFNGLGGFAKDGREYVTILGPGRVTPAPWINVVANPAFGFQVATEGSGYTWSINSRDHQLTPWSNDPVSNRPGEAFYIRDDATGDLWTPTALPIRDPEGTYVARHGRGYSQFEYTTQGIAAELLQSVPLDDPIKISRLRLRNLSNRSRHLSVTAYVEWILASTRAASAAFVATEIDRETGAMFARNPWNSAFGARVAFIDFAGRQRDWTGDRREFIGRNGDLSAPAILVGGLPLSNTVGAALDPCGAMRTSVTLPAGAMIELVFFLGEAESATDARDLIRRYRDADLDGLARAVSGFWDEHLEGVQVKTPDRALDIMLNGWLLYQTLVCRVFARSAFYQASGAYGFRDQLQDLMALATVRPDLTRAHLLRAAARQFVEGDVQHWWLPHSGQGVRTRISDDRVWLGYAVAHYVETLGDYECLDEPIPYLEGRSLEPGEHDNFFLPIRSDRVDSLYEHCALALDRSLATGRHGLPLIGTGDWNDGMNRVGEAGEGESVWLGWFLYTTLRRFIPLAQARCDDARVISWNAHAAALRASLDHEAWDGEWYLRGFFDDGSTLGSAADLECRIDSIAQSWAVLSGAADPERAGVAMASMERELIRPRDRLALLFAPPFDKTTREPGYIKGYPPGIRENGGQYTHAALWSVMAFAARGEGDKAADLLALVNPINHTRTRTGVARYKVEPYVVAADVYAVAPHTGRGGWTWYTGSAGWMYRAGMESILGLRRRGRTLVIAPCIPVAWPGFEVVLRHGSSRYEIRVDNSNKERQEIISAELDGVTLEARPLALELEDDGKIHRVTIMLG